MARTLLALTRPLRIGRFVAVSLAAAACLVPLRATAQSAEGNCQFLPGTRNLQQITLSGGDKIFYMSTPRIACSDGVRISADSAVVYTSSNQSYLMGNVHYRDRTRTMESDQARYFSQLGRLQANGHLVVRDTVQGSTIRDGYLIYLRKTDFRDEEDMNVTTLNGERPSAVLYMQPGTDTVSAADSSGAAATVPDSLAVATPDSAVAVVAEAPVDTAGPPPPPRRAPRDTAQTPYHILADRMNLKGDRYFLAQGNVEILRDSITAWSQLAEYDQLAARLRLEGDARVVGSQYDLTAKTIDIAVPGGEMRSVRAVREAVLTGDNLKLTAPVIHVFTTDGSMDRLVAVPLVADSAGEGIDGGAGRLPRANDALPAPDGRVAVADSADLARPVATAEDFLLTADSIEVNAPGQELKRIFAAGTARGESSARDSINTESLPEVARKDWMEGDTVIATFVKVEPKPGERADSAQFELDRLVAKGRARSLYRMLSTDSTAHPGEDPPAVSYIMGSQIEIVMTAGEVDSMKVAGPVQGWQLEPRNKRAARDSLLAAPDSGTVPDTVPPDTSAAPPDTTGVTRPDTVRTSAVGPKRTPRPSRKPDARPEPALVAGGVEGRNPRSRRRGR